MKFVIKNSILIAFSVFAVAAIGQDYKIEVETDILKNDLLINKRCIDMTTGSINQMIINKTKNLTMMVADKS